MAPFQGLALPEYRHYATSYLPCTGSALSLRAMPILLPSSALVDDIEMHDDVHFDRRRRWFPRQRAARRGVSIGHQRGPAIYHELEAVIGRQATI